MGKWKILLAFILCIVLIMSFVTADTVDKKVMVITYENGETQTIQLEQPHAAISRIEFIADEGKDYTDDQGHKIFLTSGAKAFADKAVAYNAGKPAPSNAKFRNLNEALGEPNYSGFTNNSDTMSGFVSLGGGGSAVVAFTKVYFYDGPGADLHVFEVGPAVEAMELEISKDGITWISVGKISGGTASVDLSGKVAETDRFSFVRLTDQKTSPSGEWPGADVDAVAAINTILK